MRLSIGCLLVLLSLQLCGQNRYLDSLSRAQYVQRFPDYFFIWPVVKQRATSFVLQSLSDPSKKLTYSPNIKTHAGLGFYLFEVGFQFVVAIPQPPSSVEEYGKSNSLDLQANIVGKNWGVDLGTENYKGYYIEDSSNPIPSGVPKIQRRDIETWNTGLTGFFFFDRRRFSVRATYNFYERQLKKAGSFVLMGHANRFVYESDALVYDIASEAYFGSEGNFNKMNFSTLAFAPGYGYNYVIKNWFLAATAAVGPSFQTFNYGVDKINHSVFEIRPYLNWRIATGFNSERFFAGVTYSYQTLEADYANINYTNRNGSLRIAVGYRFREVGVLRKRAVEFMKPKSR